MALKSYFDGGNEANSREYDIVTLAAFSGSGIQWGNFEEHWKHNLVKHHAKWLHTTDAATLNGPFSRDKGWTTTKVDAFIKDCVTIIERCAAVRVKTELTFRGIRPATVSVLLKDFKKALLKIPALESPTEICATQCLGCCFHYGEYLDDRQKFQLFFDQGEPFYGHAHDRRTNRRSRKIDQIWKKVTHLGESDMREVPALQAADLLAWSVNHKYTDGVTRDWQKRILAIDRDEEWFDHRRLLRPHREGLDIVRAWKLPRRRPFR